MSVFKRKRLVDDKPPTHVDRVLSKPPKLSDLRVALSDLTSAPPS